MPECQKLIMVIGLYGAEHLKYNRVMTLGFKGGVERISTFLNKAHQWIQLCLGDSKKYKQKYLCSFNDDFDITIETAENHLMLSMADLGHYLGHRLCTSARRSAVGVAICWL